MTVVELLQVPLHAWDGLSCRLILEFLGILPSVRPAHDPVLGEAAGEAQRLHRYQNGVTLEEAWRRIVDLGAQDTEALDGDLGHSPSG